MTYLLIGRKSPNGEHVVLDVENGILEFITYEVTQKMVALGQILSNCKRNTEISDTALKNNHKVLSEGKTAIYHVEDVYNNQGELLHHKLLFVAKHAVQRMNVTPTRLYSILAPQVQKRVMSAKPLNAKLAFEANHISKFSAVVGQVNKVKLSK